MDLTDLGDSQCGKEVETMSSTMTDSDKHQISDVQNHHHRVSVESVLSSRDLSNAKVSLTSLGPSTFSSPIKSSVASGVSTPLCSRGNLQSPSPSRQLDGQSTPLSPFLLYAGSLSPIVPFGAKSLIVPRTMEEDGRVENGDEENGVGVISEEVGLPTRQRCIPLSPGLGSPVGSSPYLDRRLVSLCGGANSFLGIESAGGSGLFLKGLDGGLLGDTSLRMDCTDSTWTLNSVLVPTPMTNEHSEIVSCITDPMVSSRKDPGQIVSVHSVNPEAQAPTDCASCIHGEGAGAAGRVEGRRNEGVGERCCSSMIKWTKGTSTLPTPLASTSCHNFERGSAQASPVSLAPSALHSSNTSVATSVKTMATPTSPVPPAPGFARCPPIRISAARARERIREDAGGSPIRGIQAWLNPSTSVSTTCDLTETTRAEEGMDKAAARVKTQAPTNRAIVSPQQFSIPARVALVTEGTPASPLPSTDADSKAPVPVPRQGGDATAPPRAALASPSVPAGSPNNSLEMAKLKSDVIESSYGACTPVPAPTQVAGRPMKHGEGGSGRSRIAGMGMGLGEAVIPEKPSGASGGFRGPPGARGVNDGVWVPVESPAPEDRPRPAGKALGKMFNSPTLSRVRMTPPRATEYGVIQQSFTPPGDFPLSEPAGLWDKESQCNCKKSRCLKLYCNCFSNSQYCGPLCNCSTCYNNPGREETLQSARRTTLERNPYAFRRRLAAYLQTTANGSVRYSIGCSCKKSACLKKYCECYQLSVLCGDECKCVGCKNIDPCRRSPKTTSGLVGRGESQISPQAVTTPIEAGFKLLPVTMAERGKARERVGFRELGESSHQWEEAVVKTLGDEGSLESSSQLLDPKRQRSKTLLAQGNNGGEAIRAFGQSCAALERTTVLDTFAFLQNDDLYNASLVSNLWCKLVLDETLWQY